MEGGSESHDNHSKASTRTKPTNISPVKETAATTTLVGIPHPLKLDICLGRGGMANNHVGNKQYRDIALLYKQSYLDAKSRMDKGIVVEEVMAQLQEEGYRFVEKSKTDSLWYPAPRVKVRAKVIQALREFAFDLRTKKEAADAASSSSDDTTQPSSPKTSSSTKIGKMASSSQPSRGDACD